MGRNISDWWYSWMFHVVGVKWVSFCSNNRNTGNRYEIYPKLTIMTPERHQWRRSGAFIVNFEHILHVLLVFQQDFEQVNVFWATVWKLTHFLFGPNLRKQSVLEFFFIELESYCLQLYVKELYSRFFLWNLRSLSGYLWKTVSEL